MFGRGEGSPLVRTGDSASFSLCFYSPDQMELEHVSRPKTNLKGLASPPSALAVSKEQHPLTRDSL